MSLLWSKLNDLQSHYLKAFYLLGGSTKEDGMERFNKNGWTNLTWSNKYYRRAHVDVVDATKSKGLFMMHVCVFPHTHNPAPIYGFDIIAGKNKITGCFHDFSKTNDSNHELMNWFSEEVKSLEWKKKRELPEWAQNIFSENMVAAGNVQDEKEIDQIVTLASKIIDYYLKNVGDTNNTVADNTTEQNYYAHNQKQNPHTPRVMTSLGLNKDDVDYFVNKCLFPDII